MNRFIQFAILILILHFFIPVSAQHEEHSHTQEHKHHLGVGFTGTHIFTTEGLHPGFHLHYLHQIDKKGHWAMGAGYEAVVAEDMHNAINYLVNFRPVHMISINAGPGVVFGKHEGEFEITPAFHTEAVLEFEINKLHLGPLVGYGIDKEDSHFSFGLHLGFGF
jgi:hypothetical protein